MEIPLFEANRNFGANIRAPQSQINPNSLPRPDFSAARDEARFSAMQDENKRRMDQQLVGAAQELIMAGIKTAEELQYHNGILRATAPSDETPEIRSQRVNQAVQAASMGMEDGRQVVDGASLGQNLSSLADLEIALAGVDPQYHEDIINASHEHIRETLMNEVGFFGRAKFGRWLDREIGEVRVRSMVNSATRMAQHNVVTGNTISGQHMQAGNTHDAIMAQYTLLENGYISTGDFIMKSNEITQLAPMNYVLNEARAALADGDLDGAEEVLTKITTREDMPDVMAIVNGEQVVNPYALSPAQQAEVTEKFNTLRTEHLRAEGQRMMAEIDSVDARFQEVLTSNPAALTEDYVISQNLNRADTRYVGTHGTDTEQKWLGVVADLNSGQVHPIEAGLLISLEDMLASSTPAPVLNSRLMQTMEEAERMGVRISPETIEDARGKVNQAYANNYGRDRDGGQYRAIHDHITSTFDALVESSSPGDARQYRDQEQEVIGMLDRFVNRIYTDETMSPRERTELIQLARQNVAATITEKGIKDHNGFVGAIAARGGLFSGIQNVIATAQAIENGEFVGFLGDVPNMSEDNWRQVIQFQEYSSAKIVDDFGGALDPAEAVLFGDRLPIAEDGRSSFFFKVAENGEWVSDAIEQSGDPMFSSRASGARQDIFNNGDEYVEISYVLDDTRKLRPAVYNRERDMWVFVDDAGSAFSGSYASTAGSGVSGGGALDPTQFNRESSRSNVERMEQQFRGMQPPPAEQRNQRGNSGLPEYMR